MNNTFIINNLKQKNSFNKQNISQSNSNYQQSNTNYQQSNANYQQNNANYQQANANYQQTNANYQQTNTKTNTNLSDTDIDTETNSKFNPDVEQNYSNAISKRDTKDFQYSTNIWKPIIGAINKDNIKAEDLKINMEKPDHIKIKSNYEIQLEEREYEKIIADKLAQEYARVNGLNKPIMEEINKPIEIKHNELNNISDIDNTFIELKSSAQDIFKDTNNLDINTIMESMSILDDLMNSVKNL